MRRPPSSILVVLSSPLSRQLDQAGARAEDDGYRLQIHVRDGRVRLYPMNGADWSKRYTLIVESAARIDGAAIIDAEVVWIGSNGVADFDALHSRVDDKSTVALAFDLLALNGEDLRRKPFSERKSALRKILKRTRCAFNMSSIPRATARKCSKPFANLNLRALFPRNWLRRIARGLSKT